MIIFFQKTYFLYDGTDQYTIAHANEKKIMQRKDGRTVLFNCSYASDLILLEEMVGKMIHTQFLIQKVYFQRDA